MDELNHTNDHLILNNSEEERSTSPSCLFVLQPFLNDDQHEETPSYQLKAPLCISQTYEEDFFDYFHMNYYGEFEHDGLFIVSIRSIPIKTNERDNKSLSFSSKVNPDQNIQLIRAIIRTENNNYNVSEMINIKNEENILEILFEKVHLSSISHYELIHHIKVNEKLLEFDKLNDDQYCNKVALIYQCLNQITENEILSNNQMSIKMENFLNLISERIELKDFNQYRGDLDNKTNQHGIYSYFTKFENHKIMFNIAPIIPTDKNDQQFIQRKSLIANALLCIVFQEEGGDILFQPDFLLGKVTQVFITVQPMEINLQLYYKIEIWRRSDIEPIVEPSGGIYKHDQSFRNYFLTLILNTMNFILNKDFFHLRIIEQRQHLKRQHIQKLSQIFSSYSKFNHKYDEDITNQNSNIKQVQNKFRRLSFIPKIIESFHNHRSSSFSQPTIKTQPSSSLRTAVFRHQEDSQRPTDTNTPFITNINNFNQSNNQISTSTINPSEQEKDNTNILSINNNQLEELII